MNSSPVRLDGVSLTWPNSLQPACDRAGITIEPGHVHALVGENGAGKTTLGHIAAGVLVPDSGVLTYGGQRIDLAARKAGLIDGIGLIRQRSLWPPVLSVIECATLGRRTVPRTRRQRIALFQETAERWNLQDIDPLRNVAGMDAAAIQRAEMISALMTGPGHLVLDEPASAWEEGRADEFFHLLEDLKSSGCGVLLITHRLGDVFRIAETVSVMRHGRLSGSLAVDRTEYGQLTRLMFGESLPDPPADRAQADTVEVLPESNRPGHRQSSPAEVPVLEARNISLNRSGRRELTDITFTVRPGEILGITGIREEGLGLLEDVVSGNRRADGGTLAIGGRVVRPAAAVLRRAGMRYVPSDKIRRGASLGSTMAENLLLLESGRLSRSGWLSPRRVRAWSESRRRSGGIVGRSDQILAELSGGNIQKVILQRELQSSGTLLVAADPTWGLDEAGKMRVHREIRRKRDSGCAVLLLSSDLDEALALADRLAVLSGGRLSPFRAAEQWERSDAVFRIAGGSS